jgi:hypothetical protein
MIFAMASPNYMISSSRSLMRSIFLSTSYRIWISSNNIIVENATSFLKEWTLFNFSYSAIECASILFFTSYTSKMKKYMPNHCNLENISRSNLITFTATFYSSVSESSKYILLRISKISLTEKINAKSIIIIVNLFKMWFLTLHTTYVNAKAYKNRLTPWSTRRIRAFPKDSIYSEILGWLKLILYYSALLIKVIINWINLHWS